MRLLSALVTVDLSLHHPSEPAGKGRRLAQLIQRAIGIEERLLRHILGQAAIPQLGIAIGHRHLLKALEQVIIGRAIPGLGAFDQQT